MGTASLGHPGHGALEGMGMEIDRRRHEGTDALVCRHCCCVRLDGRNLPVRRDLYPNIVCPTLGKQRLFRPDCLHRQTPLTD